MAFQKVSKGEKFSPNADLTNATIELLAKHQAMGHGNMSNRAKGGASGNVEVWVKNADSVNIGAFKGAVISDLATSDPGENDVGSPPVFEIDKPTADNCENPLVVLQDIAETGTSAALARAVIIGVTRAIIDIQDEDHAYADVDDSGGFVSADSGRAVILWKPTGTGEKWCFVELGGGGSGGEAYTGAWATIKDPDNANKVIVKAYDGVTYWAKNIIHTGLATNLIVSTDQTITVTVTGIIYCVITWNTETLAYEYAFANAAALPNPGNGREEFQIAAVELTDGVATVKAQIQRSDITPSKAT